MIKFYPFYDLPSFSYTVAWEGKTYKLHFTFNTRANKYFMSISDENVEYLVESIAVLPFTEIELSKYTDLSGRLILFPVSETVHTYPKNIEENYNFIYVTNGE